MTNIINRIPIDKHQDCIHYINGQWYCGQGNEISSLNPSDNNVIWQGKSATQEQVELAVHAAREASQSWYLTPITQRVAIIEHFTELLTLNRKTLTQIISEETGKPLWEAATEIGAMIGKTALSIKAHNERTGTTTTSSDGVNTLTRHKPHGVLAVFGPYNFPGHLPNGHIIPALIAGNTLIFKPSELTPLVAENILALWQQTALPAGVINMIQGDKATGQALVESKYLDGLLFTGSAQTGHSIHKAFASQPSKILALEMGGNNPLVVHDVKDSKAAVHHIIMSAFITSGQRCTCARRLFIQKNSEGDKLLLQLIIASKKLVIGKFDDVTQPFMGPVISGAVAQGLLDTQQALLDKGATPLLLMKQLPLGEAFLSPGIIDVTDLEDIGDSEVFGPLLQVYRYDTLDNAITMANNTRYGLSSGLLSDNKEDYKLFYHRIRAGIINWNKPLTGASSSSPFGGVGLSGNNRPSAYYAADYCSYPVASLESEALTFPSAKIHGLDV